MEILKKMEPKVFPNIISCDISDSSTDNEFYIHCWDGCNLSEVTAFKYPKDITDNKNTIIGMQISARGIQFFFVFFFSLILIHLLFLNL